MNCVIALPARFEASPSIADERQTVSPATLQAFIGDKPVDLPLDIEQDVDPLDGFERHRRDRRCVLSTLGVCRNVGEHEERAPRVCPAKRLPWRIWIAINLEQRIVAAIGIRLQNTGEGLQVALRMLLPSISRGIVKGGRR